MLLHSFRNAFALFGLLIVGVLVTNCVIAASYVYAQDDAPAVSDEIPEGEPPAPEPDDPAAPSEEDPAADHPAGETADHPTDGHTGDGHAKEGAGHESHDNSHSNASSNLLIPSEVRTDLAIFTFVVFALVLLLLSKFAWGPIVEALDAREDSIAGMIEKAELDAKQAEKQLQAYEQKLAQAADDAREIVAQARKDAEARGEEMIAQTREETDRLIEKAKSEIELAKSMAIQELAEESVNTAVSLAGQMIHREVKPDDHAQIIRDAIDKFPSKN